MPDLYQNARKSTTSSTEQLIAYLREHTDIQVVWPYDEMKKYMAEHTDTPLYYRTDTHWNQLGAYIGTSALLSALGIDTPEPSEANRTEIEPTWGDLYKLLALQGVLTMQDVECTQDGYPTAGTKSEGVEPADSEKYTNTGKDERHVMIARDSFGIAMSDYVGSYFAETYIFHRSNLTKSMIDDNHPDVFVYEMAERYTDNLLTFSIDESK